MSMLLGVNGRNLLHTWEQGPGGGAALWLYKDVAGKSTIGWGHLWRPGDPTTLTDCKAADDLLDKDLAPVEWSVNHHVTVMLSQNRFDALVCFTFNVGTHAFETSSLLSELNRGAYGNVPVELMKWDKAHNSLTGDVFEVPGLRNRRQAEVNLWNLVG